MLMCRAGESPEMTEREVRQHAHAVAEAEGWPWQEPLLITRHRRGFMDGSMVWHVMSNAHKRGGNVNIWLSDASGQVIKKGFARR